MLRLERSDIDRQRRVILVRLGKGKKDRFVPLGERALHWLDKYLAEARSKLSDDPQQLLLFVSTTGQRTAPQLHLVAGASDDEPSGHRQGGILPSVSPYGGTLMLDAGADIRHLQAILGHREPCTTQIYTHVSIGKLCEVHARTHPARLFRGRGATSPQRGQYARLLSPVWRCACRLIHRLLGRSPSHDASLSAD